MFRTSRPTPQSLFVVAAAVLGALAPAGSPARAADAAFAAGSLIVPMDTTYQDHGMFVGFGLVDALLRAGIPVDWVILQDKGFGAADMTVAAVTDGGTGATLFDVAYRGGPFVIAADHRAEALPIVNAWRARHPRLTVHEADGPFLAPVARHLIAAPSIAIFADGHERIAFKYLNAAQIPQGLRASSRAGNRVVAADLVNRTATPVVVSAPAGLGAVRGTCSAAAGTLVDVFAGDVHLGSATVQAGGAWALEPAAVPSATKVWAAATQAGKGTSARSNELNSGALPAGGDTAAPVFTDRVREGDAVVYGRVAEPDGTAVALYRDGSLEARGGVSGGLFAIRLAAPARGGDLFTARATRPGGTDSAAVFTYALPIPPIVLPPLATGSVTISGRFGMAEGSTIALYRDGSADAPFALVAVNNKAAWSGVAATLAAGEAVRAGVAHLAWPPQKDNSGAYACPGQFCCADCFDEQAVAGPSSAALADGALFRFGAPRVCQLMSMHYGAGDPDVVAEVRSFLQFPTHAFFECAAVNAFENDPAHGRFLTTGGLLATGTTAPVYYFGQDSPFAQADAAYENTGGSEMAFSLAPGSLYHDSNVVLVAAADVPGHGQDDMWMTGFLDGNPAHGKVSYLGGHAYEVALPISANPASVGTRYFLNSLFEAPCSTTAVPRLGISLRLAGSGCSPTLTIDFSSTGAGVLGGVVVRVPLPGGTTLVGATDGGALAGDEIVWRLGDLAAGASGSVSAQVAFDADGSASFGASVTWTAGLTPGMTSYAEAFRGVCDTVPPAGGTSAPVAGTYTDADDEDAGTPGFQLTPNGTREDGAAVRVASLVPLAGGPAPALGAITYPTATTWTLPPVAWNAGTYELTIEIVDAAGNVTTSRVTFTVQLTGLLRAVLADPAAGPGALAPLFPLYPGDPALDRATQLSISPFESGARFPQDEADLAAPAHGLVFYQVDRPLTTLRVAKSGGRIVITY